MSDLRNARFLTSAAKPADIPPGQGLDIAFAGRSNVGKSSAINALTGRRRLAYFSRTPGRTRTINFFDLGSQGRLADLPGYGYASAPRALRAGWDALVGGYLRGGRGLAGVVILMDARHPLAAADRHFLGWLEPGTRCLVLLSKSDKLARHEARSALRAVREGLALLGVHAEVMVFSSRSGEGVDAARIVLKGWLADPPRRPK